MIALAACRERDIESGISIAEHGDELARQPPGCFDYFSLQY